MTPRGTLVLALILAACSSGGESGEGSGEEAIATTTVDVIVASTTTPTATTVPAPVSTVSSTTAPTAPPTTAPPSTTAPASDLERLISGSAGLDLDLDDEALLCAVERIQQDEALVELVAEQGDLSDASPEQQAIAALIAFDCAPDAVAAELVTAFDSGSGGGFPPDVGNCFVDAMSEGAADRETVVLGLVYLGNEVAPPPDVEEVIVDTMVTCVPGRVFGELIGAEAVADPGLAEALDATCVGEGLDEATMRPVWSAQVQNPSVDFDELPADVQGPMIEAIFGCISFGQVMAAQAAIEGVELSETSITCIDDDLSQVDLAGMFLAGSDSEAEAAIGLAIFTCLTPEEIVAIS